MSLAKWTDADGVHHWIRIRNSYGKLVWVGFEATTAEFRSDTKANWVMRPLCKYKYTNIYIYIKTFMSFTKMSKHTSKIRHLFYAVCIYIYIL